MTSLVRGCAGPACPMRGGTPAGTAAADAVCRLAAVAAAHVRN